MIRLSRDLTMDLPMIVFSGTTSDTGLLESLLRLLKRHFRLFAISLCLLRHLLGCGMLDGYALELLLALQDP
jgi:hypothetical protein